MLSRLIKLLQIMSKQLMKNAEDMKVTYSFERKRSTNGIVKNKYYTEVAEKLGELIRRDIVTTHKKRKSSQSESLQFGEKTFDIERPFRLPPPKFSLHRR